MTPIAADWRLYLWGGEQRNSPVVYILKMHISHDQLTELTEVIEDTIEYACDKECLSGELAWTIVECLATTKLAELRGELAAA